MSKYDSVLRISNVLLVSISVKDLVHIIVQYATFSTIEWTKAEETIFTLWPFHHLLVTEDQLACGYARKHWFSLNLKVGTDIYNRPRDSDHISREIHCSGFTQRKDKYFLLLSLGREIVVLNK